MRRVVVTLPAHNEEKTIGPVLQGVFNIAATLPQFQWHVIVVDDCSTDSTAQVAEQAGATVFRLPTKSGLAAVFRQEMRLATEAQADWIVHLDSDGQHPPQAIPQLLAELEQGHDLVIGSRFLASSPAGKPQVQQFESRSFSKLLSWITGQPLTDVHSGYRAFTLAVAQQIQITSQFSYAREQLFRAACRGYRLKDVPVTAAIRQQGQSRLIKNRSRLMLAVTWRYCRWSIQERRSRLRIPLILGWGVGVVVISAIWRGLQSLKLYPWRARLIHPKPKG